METIPVSTINSSRLRRTAWEHMHDTARTTDTPARRPGPPPAVYVIIRVIGCRVHWRSVADGWTPHLSAYVLHWMSDKREDAYQAAQAVRGLLVKMTREEWAAAMDAWAAMCQAAAEADERRHG